MEPSTDTSPINVIDPLAGVDFSQLDKSLRRPRTLADFVMNGIVAAMTVTALIPLFSVILMLLWRGGRRLSVSLFTQLPPAPLEQGGGFGNAIVGTLVIVALAVLVTVPIGLMAAIYLAQANDSRLGERAAVQRKSVDRLPFHSGGACSPTVRSKVLTNGRLLDTGRRRRACPC